MSLSFRLQEGTKLLIVPIMMYNLTSCIGAPESHVEFSQEVVEASESYKKSHDYESLEILVDILYVGMGHATVEKLLGQPDYSPADGVFYYSSTKSVISDESGLSTTVGLALDYTRPDDSDPIDRKVTDELQAFRLGPIGE